MNTPVKLGLCVEKMKTWKRIKLSTIKLEKLHLRSSFKVWEESLFFSLKSQILLLKVFNLNQIWKRKSNSTLQINAMHYFKPENKIILRETENSNINSSGSQLLGKEEKRNISITPTIFWVIHTLFFLKPLLSTWQPMFQSKCLTFNSHYRTPAKI